MESDIDVTKNQIVERKAEPQNMLAVIERAAMNPDVDVDKMRALLEMKQQIDARDAEMVFNRAMNRCQSEIGRIAADKTNNQTRSDYASYAALDRVVRPIYTKYGFSLSFDTGEIQADTIDVLCYVSHEDGHTRRYHTPMPADGKGAKGGDVMTKTHAAGSAMQYGQRYLLKLIFNLAIGQDDDGNAAGSMPCTEDQILEIESEIDAYCLRVSQEKGRDYDEFKEKYITEFKKVFGIEFLKDLPAKRYGEAMRMIKAKKK